MSLVICQSNSFLTLLSQVLREAIYFHQVEYTKCDCWPNPISENEVKTFKKCPLELRHCKELFSFWGATNRLHFSQWSLSHAEKRTFSKPLNFSNKSWDWNVKQLEIGKLRRRWWPLINGFNSMLIQPFAKISVQLVLTHKNERIIFQIGNLFSFLCVHNEKLLMMGFTCWQFNYWTLIMPTKRPIMSGVNYDASQKILIIC